MAIKTAVIGVGNCASCLVQGVRYYGDSENVVGLMHPRLGTWEPGDIEFVAAFDVDADKVGKDLSEAIWGGPNNAPRFADVPRLGVEVKRGPVLDGLGEYGRKVVRIAPGTSVNAVDELRAAGAEVVVNFLPVGSTDATRFWAQAALDAGCGFVNCMPAFIASDERWAAKFAAAGLPVIGDDIKSQVGATITHRVLAKLMADRGLRLNRTFQLNFGGNMDFYNMLQRERLHDKKLSKTESVQSNLPLPLPSENIHVGPSDHVPWLGDRKWCYIRLEGTTFGGQPLDMEVKLEVVDSPNSAGVVVDAIRCCRIAMDRKMSGSIISVSAYLMKSPPVQMPDDQGRAELEQFIRGADLGDVPVHIGIGWHRSTSG